MFGATISGSKVEGIDDREVATDEDGVIERIRSKRTVLAGAALATMTVLPIGIHTLLLDDLGVPYPSALPRVGWALVPDHALLILGLICFNGALRQHSRQGFFWRSSFLFLAVAAINQALLRLPIMRNVVSTKWTIYPFIDNLPAVLWYGAAVLLAMIVGRAASTKPRKLVAALGLAVILDFVVAPTTTAAFAPMIAADGLREGDQLYTVPYDWHVDVSSYLTYVEPALAALAGALVLRRLRASPGMIVALLFALQAGPLFRIALNVWYAPIPPAVAVISEGQFTLEALALAALAAAFACALTGRGTPTIDNDVRPARQSI